MNITRRFICLIMTLAFFTSQAHANGWQHDLFVSTQDAISVDSDDTRANVDEFLQREIVQVQLHEMGVDANDARQQLALLTDKEVAQLAGAIEQLPAAGFFEGEEESASDKLINILPILILLALLFAMIFKSSGKKAKY